MDKETPKQFYELCKLFLDALQEPNKEEFLKIFGEKTNNFKDMKTYTVTKLFKAKKYLANIGLKRHCEIDVHIALNKILHDRYDLKQFLITFVENYEKFELSKSPFINENSSFISLSPNSDPKRPSISPIKNYKNKKSSLDDSGKSSSSSSIYSSFKSSPLNLESDQQKNGNNDQNYENLEEIRQKLEKFEKNWQSDDILNQNKENYDEKYQNDVNNQNEEISKENMKNLNNNQKSFLSAEELPIEEKSFPNLSLKNSTKKSFKNSNSNSISNIEDGEKEIIDSPKINLSKNLTDSLTDKSFESITERFENRQPWRLSDFLNENGSFHQKTPDDSLSKQSNESENFEKIDNKKEKNGNKNENNEKTEKNAKKVKNDKINENFDENFCENLGENDIKSKENAKNSENFNENDEIMNEFDEISHEKSYFDENFDEDENFGQKSFRKIQNDFDEIDENDKENNSKLAKIGNQKNVSKENKIISPKEITEKFASDRQKYIRHNSEITLRTNEGYFMNEIEEKKLGCCNFYESIFKIKKKIFSSKNPYIYPNEEILLTNVEEKKYLSDIEGKIVFANVEDNNFKEENANWILHYKNIKNSNKKYSKSSKKRPKICFFEQVRLSRKRSFLNWNDQNQRLEISDEKTSFWTLSKHTLPLADKFFLRSCDSPFFKIPQLDQNFSKRPKISETEKDIIFRILCSLLKKEMIDLTSLECEKEKNNLSFKLCSNRYNISKEKQKSVQKFENLLTSVNIVFSVQSELRKPFYGFVVNSFCQALDKISIKFEKTLSELDILNKKSELTLQMLWLCLQPAYKLYYQLHLLCLAISPGTHGNCIAQGGECLNIIVDFFGTIGNKNLKKIFFESIVQPSFAPYIEFLNDWMLRGHIKDPHSEFMVVKNRIKNSIDFSDQFWRQKYTLHHLEKNIPIIFRPFADSVLNTGKFVLVLSHVGRDLGEVEAFRLCNGDFKFKKLTNNIYPLYKNANKILLNVLLSEGLLSCLDTLKHIFLLSRGDFYRNTLCDIDSDLKRLEEANVNAFINNRIEAAFQSLFLDSIFSSKIKIVIWKNNFIFQLETFLGLKLRKNLNDKIIFKGIDFLGFDFNVEWPLNFFFTKSSVFRYNLIFRFLIVLKKCESKLTENWLEIKSAKRLRNDSLRKMLNFQRKLRHFVQSFLHYFQIHVVERFWGKLVEQISKEKSSFDRVLKCHEEFLDQIFKYSFLTDSKAFNEINCSTEIILQFHNLLKRFLNDWNLIKIGIDNNAFEGKFNMKSFIYNKKLSQNFSDFLKNQQIESRTKELELLFDLSQRNLMSIAKQKATAEFGVFSVLLDVFDCR